jgi:hypothetical protein
VIFTRDVVEVLEEVGRREEGMVERAGEGG